MVHLLILLLLLAFCECGNFGIGIGCRNNPDVLLFEETLSTATTDSPDNHTILFRFISDVPVSYVEFKTNYNVHTEISFYQTHAICIKLTHYDIDSLNGTIYIYGYDNVTHSTQCTEPLLLPDPTDEANFLSEDDFCSDSNLSSFRVVDYLDFGLRNGSLANLRERNGTATTSSAPIVIADTYVINVFSLCCTIHYVLSYLINARNIRI